ncbi:uncharacterized protein ACO6RY_14780 [Pungitius sinensis]
MFCEKGTQSQICVAINGTTWKHFNCAERKPFMCHIGSNYTLITRTEKNWCQALQYCRTHNGDLVSIGNDTEEERVIEKGEGKSFWIGLLNDDWAWADGGCSTFREWKTSGETGDDPLAYTYYRLQNGLIKGENWQNAHSLCSKGTTRIKVIHHNLTWEQAFDYCKENHTGLLQIIDENDQEAVVQWLNYTSAGGPYWIGLRQSRVFGFWIWSDRMVNFSNWKNDTQPQLPMSNLCGAIGWNNTWTDEDCMVPRPFICEEEIVFMNKSRWR